jgi:thiosulfate/3-mercaptopyruvate sulfurtransferase
MRLIVAATFAALFAADAQTPNTSMLVSTDWLARRIGDPQVVVLHVGHGDDFKQAHIPGARPVEYDDVTIERDGISSELPAPAQLARAFEKLGISDASHVVIYPHDGRMGPMASRVFLALDYIGHDRVSLLDGGLVKWRSEGRPVSAESPVVAPGRITPRPRPVTVDAQWVNARTGARGVAFIDTRTTPEYLGNGTRSGLPSSGHVAGARQLEWEQLFSDLPSGTFLDMPALAKLFSDRVAPGDTVVTYCLVGYRASMTYFAARLLGYPTRLYDGSYQEWAKLGLPTKKGEAP